MASGDAWKRAFDAQSGKVYFYHMQSKRTQIQNPQMYDAKTGRWKLLDPPDEKEKEKEEEDITEGDGSRAKVEIKSN